MHVGRETKREKTYKHNTVNDKDESDTKLQEGDKKQPDAVGRSRTHRKTFKQDAPSEMSPIPAPSIE